MESEGCMCGGKKKKRKNNWAFCLADFVLDSSLTFPTLEFIFPVCIGACVFSKAFLPSTGNRKRIIFLHLQALRVFQGAVEGQFHLLPVHLLTVEVSAQGLAERNLCCLTLLLYCAHFVSTFRCFLHDKRGQEGSTLTWIRACSSRESCGRSWK